MSRLDAGTFDYVIVGAGSAGCVLAARLSEDPAVGVALVEAGGPDNDPDIRVPLASMKLLGSAVDWAFNTVEQAGMAGREIYWPRGRTLGGSSSINFQMWVPGHALDYKPWVQAAGESWSWESVLPYFRKAERWAGDPEDGHTHGSDGPLWISPPRDPDPSTIRFIHACVEAGLKEIPGGLGGPDNTGCAITPLNQAGGSRWSTADGYVRPARHRANLKIFTDELVHRVLLNEHNRATGVELGHARLTARREVVLCAGAVGSPQLLMLSGIGEAGRLRAAGVTPRVELPGVGRNLQDHLILDLAMKAIGPVPLTAADTPASRQRFEQERLGPLTSNVGEAVAFFRSDGGSGAPDLELIWAPVAFSDDGVALPGRTIGVVLLQPHSRGRIDLADADPASAPRIDPAYLTVGPDLRTFIAGVRFAEQLFDTEALRPLVDGPLAPWPGRVADDALGKLIRQRAQTVYHPVGTCRIGGAGDVDAVVDPRLRVRGVDGLRVVDASVIPRVPRGHTHAPAVMIGERGADLIRQWCVGGRRVIPAPS